MLFLKAFSCVVICFGIVQTKCIENKLLEKVLESNISNTAKLEEVNKIVLNGLLRKETSPNNLIQPNPIPGPLIHQLPDTPTSELWNPWSNLGRSKPRSNTRRKVKPSVMWNPWAFLQLQGRSSNALRNQQPSVASDPWGSEDLREQNSEPTRYQPSSWNPLNPAESQLNSYQTSYPNQISGDRSVPYYDDRQPDMNPAGPYSLYSNQFQPSVPSGNNPSMPMVENTPFKYNMLKNMYS